MTTSLPKPEKRENPFISIVFNIALPAIILSKFSGETALGPVFGLIVAIAFPLTYGLWDFFNRKKANFISILGLLSVLLTGGFGLMQLSGLWFAAKEAAIPLVIGVILLISQKSERSLVRTMLYNDAVVNVEAVQNRLAEAQKEEEFRELLRLTTWLLAGSFLLSAILNFTLAMVILKSPSGTEAFNQELGQMTALSYPVIVIPCMIITVFALWRLASGIKKLTGLELEAILKTQK